MNSYDTKSVFSLLLTLDNTEYSSASDCIINYVYFV
jgi:hypothetical protein